MTRSTFASLAFACGLIATSLGDARRVDAGGGLFQQRSVGGVAINAEGVLEAPTVQDERELAQLREQTPLKAPAALDEFTELRAVSLKQIEATLQKCAKDGQPIPDEVKYLAGLQRVRYVFIYPERNDIVLAGPAEGWKMDGLGNVVGATTNYPVLMLDDLMTALRSGSSSRTEPITCSIDPTKEGLQRLQQAMRGRSNIGVPEQTFTEIEEAVGLQQISVTGVPDTSHFARTMVAADFRMKRLAMDFEPAPVKDMPSFLSMTRSTGHGVSNMMQRWWLAPSYEPLAKTADGLAWELRGPGVKCLTEESYVDESGDKAASGKKNTAAEKWAANMSEKFSELSKVDSSFGQLRNIMDLAVIGALVEKERLLDIASLQLPRLLGEEQLDRYPAPKHTPTKVSAAKQRREWIMTASGGVEMLPWHIASEVETVEAVGDVRKELTADVKEFWWE